MSPETPPYHYRPEMLEALAAHGIRPDERTPPELVRDFLNDIYRWEIRKLRDAVVSGALPKGELAPRVVLLRRRYPLLSIPLEAWVRDRHTE